LNTVVVGLDAVEKGHPKPDTLRISWNPHDRSAAARKARRFTLEAVLVRASESIGQYVTAISKLRRFEPIRSKWNGDTSAVDKLLGIGEAAVGKKSYLLQAAALLMHWRNRVVHAKSNASLDRSQIGLLKLNEDEIACKYAGLSIDLLLTNFHAARPTLKDVSSLISMSINLIREIDATATDDFTKDDLDALLDHYGLSRALVKVRNETAPDKLDSSIRKAFHSLAPKLLPAYEKYYMT
jgi:hypothetical protein